MGASLQFGNELNKFRDKTKYDSENYREIRNEVNCNVKSLEELIDNTEAKSKINSNKLSFELRDQLIKNSQLESALILKISTPRNRKVLRNRQVASA